MPNQTNNNSQLLATHVQTEQVGSSLSTSLSHLQFGSLIELFNGTAEGMFVIDQHGNFEFVNPVAAQLLGDSQPGRDRTLNKNMI